MILSIVVDLLWKQIPKQKMPSFFADRMVFCVSSYEDLTPSTVLGTQYALSKLLTTGS